MALNDLGSSTRRTASLGVEGNWDTKFVAAEISAAEGDVAGTTTRVLERTACGWRGWHRAGRPRRNCCPKDDGVYTLYLHHVPDAIDELRRRDPEQRVDLFLCGHTHGGQVCLPFWGAVITLGKYHKKYERGLYSVDGVPMYVNRGVGSGGGGIPHVRFLARPEVAVIDLYTRSNCTESASVPWGQWLPPPAEAVRSSRGLSRCALPEQLVDRPWFS